MTLDEYTQLLEAPLSVEADQIQPLQDLLAYAPYCVSAQLLLLKALYDSGQKKAATACMPRAILAAPQEVSVYFLLNPKKVRAKVESKRAVTQRVVGEKEMSYFELIDRMQKVAQKNGITFEELAKRHLEARQYSRES